MTESRRHSTISTAWVECGEGEPLVFLHGLGGTSSAWGPQLEHFAASRRCLAWDMPGYGDSDPIVPLTYGAIADQFVAFLDRAQIESTDVVGLSFGGMHALHVALRHPARLRRVVLANTSPAFGLDGTDPEQWKKSRLAAIDGGETLASIAPVVLDSIVGRPLDADVRSELIASFERIGVEGFRQAVNCLPDNDVRDQLHQITHQCLVIAGALDQETPVAYGRQLSSGLPNAELVVLADIGHLSPSEDPCLFNETVANFLAS